LKSAEIRESFLAFFESKGCRRLPSSSLVPDDPSLLLTSAGMVQFKPVFLGVEKRDYTRATTCQKCVRTTDIEIVGHTGRHQTFFEMLGNFSFGDYFKAEIIPWSYEYSTEVLGLDPDRLWFSVYEDDDEAEAIWLSLGITPERIVRMGAKDNFWSAGPTGPCGPCSELYFDQGADVGCGLDTCAPGCDCDRFLEYWNLVFMQYDRQEDGTLVPLPKKNIDTGLGLERMAGILQHVGTNYETDILAAIVAEASAICGVAYGASQHDDVSLRILADHARALAFMIADGVLPSNEGRGYVLRRLLRRAVRHGRLLGVTEPFLTRLTAVVFDEMAEAYPELIENRELIERIVGSEEVRFGATLRQGLALLEEQIDMVRGEQGSVLPGDVAFALHDTYGFPVELTSEIVHEAGMTVDMEAFEIAMTQQRERGRAGVKDVSWGTSGAAYARAFEHLPRGAVEFVGYEVDEADATIAGIVVDGEPSDSLTAGQAGEIVLDLTPFYGEQGGQVGDTGAITTDAATFEVRDARIPVRGLVSHLGTVTAGTLSVGEKVHARIDVMRRERIRRNHTATHLLHWALRLVLGEHVKQSGSFVAPERLRFDFTHFEAPTRDQLDKVERLVNTKIMEDHPVRAYETSLVSAREAGVTALFGEKYGEFVRVLEIGNFSRELCGGTHVGRTAEIGLLKISSEGSVGANLRRIEAATSFDAMELVYGEEAVLRRAADALKCRTAEVAEKAEATVQRLREAEKAAKSARHTELTPDTLETVRTPAGYPLRIGRVDGLDAEAMRAAADEARGSDGAVVMFSVSGGSVLMLAAGSDAAVKAGFDAGAVVREAAPSIGGRGGGKASMAQAGGADAGGIPAAIDAVRRVVGVV
jgi:alanyl-tRNA synthetase